MGRQALRGPWIYSAEVYGTQTVRPAARASGTQPVLPARHASGRRRTVCGLTPARADASGVSGGCVETVPPAYRRSNVRA